MKRRLLFIPLLVLAGLFSGCATGPQLTETGIKDTEILFAEGNYLEAAKQFNQLAQQASPRQRTEFLLRAAAALARADRLHQSRQLLRSLRPERSNPRHTLLLHLTEAHIALVERRPDDALNLLREPAGPRVDAYYLADYHDIRADAFTMLGNRLETARELVLREAFLSHPQLITANQHDIWEALSLLTERALQQLRTAPPPDILSGWMELVQIAKAFQLHPATLKEAVIKWRQRYPSHPVDKQMLEGLQSRRQEDVRVPTRVALLLPFSSKFARAAEAVRDGFLAAYYSNKSDNVQDQTIQVYDVADAPETALAAYQRAIGDGAQFVVGPLSKEAIDRIADDASISVPTLALNNSREEDIPDNLFQFGLSPEEEARQVAERTWLDGHVNAAVLTPAGPWGERVYQAFKQRWEQIGGHIVEQQNYETAKKDFSTPIRMLLNIDESKRRSRNLAFLLKQKFKFQPRRRQDIDFIFLAAYPRQARQIRPQLKFYHAADVPVYATSHVFTGNLNQERDRDMDGLVFGDMPWVLTGSTAHRGLRADIEQHISRAGNSLQRLYALGIDAYNIIAALSPLKQYPYERYDGETGSLSLDVKQRIRRQLTWVKFRSGRPRLLDEGLQ